MQPFQRFLDTWRREHGLTYQRIEDAGGPKRSTMAALINEPRRGWPDAVTIKQVAVGMGVPESMLWQKLQETLGAPGPERGEMTPEHAILADRDLSNDQKDALLAQLRIIRQLRGTGPAAEVDRPARRRRSGT